jgi:UDP-glucose 4-epimerase
MTPPAEAQATHGAPAPGALLVDQRVLVTGASGFLGMPLCQRLAEGAAEVHAVSRLARSAGSDRLRWWQSNLEDVDAVRALLGSVKPDVIFHLGGLVNGAPEPGLVLPTFHSLLTSTVNILSVATELGCRRLVLAGSLEEPQGGVDATPASPYGAAKWAASGYGRMFHRLYQAPVVILRTFMTYGPGQPEWKVIPYSILSLLEGRAPEISSGERCLDWVYVDDVVDGFVRAGSVPGVEGMTLDLGSGRTASIRDVVMRVAALVGSRVAPLFGARPDRPVQGTRVADAAGALAALGWGPRTGLDEGLARTVPWFRRRFEERRMRG